MFVATMALSKVEVDNQVYGHKENSTSRPYTFLDIALSGCIDPPDAFWKCIMEYWNGFDALPHGQYQKLFRWYRDYWSPDFMGGEARSFYDGLPERLLVYRGHDRSRIHGLSFTVDMDMAKSFARGHRGLWNSDPVIMTRRIKKMTSLSFVLTGTKANWFCGERVPESWLVWNHAELRFESRSVPISEAAVLL